MSFTYSDDLLLERDRIRFAVGDTTEEAGPKPEDANYTDEELAGLLAIEGTWQRTAAAVFENLAGLWSRHVTFSAAGMSANQSDIAAQYRLSATEWRQQWGGSSTFGSVAPIRADGYSDDIDSTTTDSDLLAEYQ